jgi:hypothetical protein
MVWGSARGLAGGVGQMQGHARKIIYEIKNTGARGVDSNSILRHFTLLDLIG